jgi:hypothetical protein
MVWEISGNDSLEKNTSLKNKIAGNRSILYSFVAIAL